MGEKMFVRKENLCFPAVFCAVRMWFRLPLTEPLAENFQRSSTSVLCPSTLYHAHDLKLLYFSPSVIPDCHQISVS